MPNFDVYQRHWEAVLPQMADPHPQSFCNWVMLMLLVWVPQLRTIRQAMTPVECSFGLKDTFFISSGLGATLSVRFHQHCPL